VGELRSNFEPGTTRWAMRLAQWTALGLTPDDMEMPKIAIVNSSQMSGVVNKGISVAEVSPEGAVGGPLGLVRDGDIISVDIDARTIELEVPETELARRRAELPPPAAPAGCGWLSLYARSVRPLGEGATLGG
jgi:dihydroxy-acid dehydratase